MRRIDRSEFFEILDEDNATISDIEYGPNYLRSLDPTGRWRVKGKTFKSVGFSKTIISKFEFTNCSFESCIFINTQFIDCRFNGCLFKDCNVFRLEFESVLIDPAAFRTCITDKSRTNIGISLFQDLLQNSRLQAQPDFADEALFQFRNWQRYAVKERLCHEKWGINKPAIFLNYVKLCLHHFSSGSGTSLAYLLRFIAVIILLFSFFTFLMSSWIGICDPVDHSMSFLDSVYYVVVVMTTLGFGDISPTTVVGRMFCVLIAMTGVIMFAITTSILFRRISS